LTISPFIIWFSSIACGRGVLDSASKKTDVVEVLLDMAQFLLSGRLNTDIVLRNIENYFDKFL
jgi:hypothetical protein